MKRHASMNRVYRLIWSQTLGAWVCCAENAKGRGKSMSGRKLIAAALALMGGLFLAPLAMAGPTDGQVSAGAGTISQTGTNTTITQSTQNMAINWQSFNIAANESVRFIQPSAMSVALNRVVGQDPSQILGNLNAMTGLTGGQVSAGAGTISQTGTNTTITQSTQNMAINWQSFNIAANESVRFIQPNAMSVALNRVVGQDPSQILGSLSANGQVFVINPNGVLFGSSAQVNVGGLVATTLNLSDADFMAGNYRFSSPRPLAGEGQGRGVVINQGNLTAAQGGYIALLAPEVRNEGVISATLGTALLAAGDKVTLNLNNGSLLSYTIDQGALQALADNKQLIQADGGQVFMSAKAADNLSSAVVNNTGIIQARTIRNVAGVIRLEGDVVNVTGTLDTTASPSAIQNGLIEIVAQNGVSGSTLNTSTNNSVGGSSGATNTNATSIDLSGSVSFSTGTIPNATITSRLPIDLSGNVSLNASKFLRFSLISTNGTIPLSVAMAILNLPNGQNLLPLYTSATSPLHATSYLPAPTVEKAPNISIVYAK